MPLVAASFGHFDHHQAIHHYVKFKESGYI